MRGRLVYLSGLTEEDLELLVAWCQPGQLSSSLSGSNTSYLTVDRMREDLAKSGQDHLMVRKLDGTTIGALNYRSTGLLNFELGVAIGETELWGRGHGVEAVMLLLDYLFHVRGAQRVQAVTGLHNPTMLSIITKSPMLVEGVLRNFMYVDGAYQDAVMASLLRAEYYAGGRYYSIPDAVPPEDKARGRALLQDHFTKRDDGFLAAVVARTDDAAMLSERDLAPGFAREGSPSDGAPPDRDDTEAPDG